MQARGPFVSLSQLLIVLLIPCWQHRVQAKSCKAVPNSPSWPSKAQWDTLNSSIAGQLLEPLPPAPVCDSSLAVYNNASCSYVTSQWTVSDFHAREPISVDQSNWENDACIPGRATRCTLAQFPPYVANVTSGENVKAVMDFARRGNLRLIVKGTGHDYLGRFGCQTL